MAMLVAAFFALLASACGTGPTPVTPAPSLIPSRLTLTTDLPSVLRSGSRVTVTVRVTDENGSTVPGARVELTTDTGFLDPPRFVTTDATGMASAILTTGEPATIRASGAGQNQQQTLPAVAPYSIRVSAPSSVTLGTDAEVLVTMTPNASALSPPAPASIRVSCGTGVTSTMTGVFGQSVARCSFPTASAFTLTASAIAGNGWTLTESAGITVTPVPAPTPTPSPTPAPPRSPDFSISAVNERCTTTRSFWRFTVVGRTSDFKIYDFDFGDGDRITTSNPDAGHEYDEEGYRTVTVTGTTTVGSDEVQRQKVILVRFGATCG